MTRREWVVCELQRLGRLAQTIHMRYAAYIQLHTAATVNGDKQEMTERREQIHDTLDHLLDNAEAIQALAQEVETLP